MSGGIIAAGAFGVRRSRVVRPNVIKPLPSRLYVGKVDAATLDGIEDEAQRLRLGRSAFVSRVLVMGWRCYVEARNVRLGTSAIGVPCGEAACGDSGIIDLIGAGGMK